MQRWADARRRGPPYRDLVSVRRGAALRRQPPRPVVDIAVFVGVAAVVVFAMAVAQESNFRSPDAWDYALGLTLALLTLGRRRWPLGILLACWCCTGGTAGALARRAGPTTGGPTTGGAITANEIDARAAKGWRDDTASRRSSRNRTCPVMRSGSRHWPARGLCILDDPPPVEQLVGVWLAAPACPPADAATKLPR